MSGKINSHKANPGGQIDPKQVIGRDRLIDEIWETIELQSIEITAERRIGKTTIMKKMEVESKSGWTVVYQDLEKCHSAAEFANVVYKEINRFLSVQKRSTNRANDLLKNFGGIEIAGIFKLPEQHSVSWKDLLSCSIADLAEQSGIKPERLLFFWDEMPYMLAAIRDNEGERVAMEILDTLRALRNTHDSLRIIVTGSIGMHHVIGSLKDKNYLNDPHNDLYKINVNPLKHSDGAALAVNLLKGEKLNCEDIQGCGNAISLEADGFPFYIHHIVKSLRHQCTAVDIDSIKAVVETHLTDPDDPWKLTHYRERIKPYFDDAEPVVVSILDILSTTENSMSLSDLLGALKNTSTFDSRDKLINLLSMMARDHYLRRDSKGLYAFNFPLIQRWWKISRDL